MRRATRWIQCLGLLALAVHGWAGCAGAPPATRYYTLESASWTAGPVTAAARPVILLGPVSFPAYLDHPQIVTRSGANTLELAEFDQWAGSLQEDFVGVLARQLGNLSKAPNVLLFPKRSPVQPDYQVIVDVSRFDGRLGGDVDLEASWALMPLPAKEPVKNGRSTIREHAGGADYAALVAALGRAVAGLGHEIGSALEGMAPALPGANAP